MTFGYQKDSITEAESNVGNNVKSSAVNDKGKNAASQTDLEFTSLDQIDPMLDNIKIKGRCISMWHSHPAGKPKQAYSFDIVLQDMQGNRIQCTARNNDMYRFEPLFQQGHCYIITDFSIGENNGILPLLNHKYKITFFQSTKVTRIDHFDDDVFGFKLEPFSQILSKKYNEKESVDVVGAIVAIGDIMQVPNTLVKKVRRTIVIEDKEGTRVKCTFWDSWAEMFNQYANNEDIGLVIFVLQLAKVKYFRDEPAVHNSLFGSRIFINKEIPTITSFKEMYTSKEGYADGDHKIEVFTPPVEKITPEMFFKHTVRSTIGGIPALQPGTEIVLYAKVHRIHKEHGWCYDACKRCNKMAKQSTSSGSKKAYSCAYHGTIYQVVPRFKLILRVIDETGSAPFVVFDTNISKMCNGVSAYELMTKHGQNTAEYFPDELNVIVGKKYLFKFTYTQHNVNSNSQVYTAKTASDDADLIAHFKEVFADGQEVDDQYKTPDNSSSAHSVGLDAAAFNINKFLLETPDNQSQYSTTLSAAASANIQKFLLETPDNETQSTTSRTGAMQLEKNSASGKAVSGEKNDESPGSKGVNKKRDIIDLDDLPDEDDASASAKKPLLATVKIEKDE